MSVETLAFQAETKELLRLMIHSLYTEKDIFLRELISNASDALDRLRFESLTNAELLENDDKFEIRLDVDKELKTLTVSDSGIGMTREEVVANIGTIARSGTGELKRRLQEDKSAANVADLIGQFGVGFYSAFMVADKVKLVTRRAGSSEAVAWESDGSGSYTIGDAEKPERGTSVTLYLRTPDPDNGIEGYTDAWRISSIVRKHSDFIAYPIIAKKDDKDETLNSMKPIWKRSPSEITKEEYIEFYKHVSHDWNDPLKTIHFRAEGTFEYEALLYIPSKAPWDLYYMGSEAGGVRLFARRVMIMEKCEDLLPRYLRFVRGVVDAFSTFRSTSLASGSSRMRTSPACASGSPPRSSTPLKRSTRKNRSNTSLSGPSSAVPSKKVWRRITITATASWRCCFSNRRMIRKPSPRSKTTSRA